MKIIDQLDCEVYTDRTEIETPSELWSQWWRELFLFSDFAFPVLTHFLYVEVL